MAADSKRPWAERAIALEPKEGHYSDYAAFVEWLDEKSVGIRTALEDDLLLIDLYCLVADAYDGAPATTEARSCP